MHVRALVAMAMLATSAAVSGAQPASSTSSDGRANSIEVFATNRTPLVVTIADVHGYSGRSTGKRQHQPVRVAQRLAAGAVNAKGTASGVSANLYGDLPLEEISFVFSRIEWTANGATQSCSAKVPASYRASDKKVVLQVGDVASLMTPEGRPIPTKCQGI